jgi:hypothetical protein
MMTILAVVCLAGCDAADTPSPLEQCLDDATAECCGAADCDGDQVCDFSYICSAAPRGGTQCSEGTGTRTCLDPCGAGDACESGHECVDLEIFEGSDSGETFRVCRALTR